MVDYDWRSAEEKLAKVISGLQDRITALESAGLRLPFVDADPAAQYGNVWMFNDNKVHIRKPDGTIREIITTAPGGTGTGTPLPPAPVQTSTHRSEWAASWSQTYRQSGAQRSEDTLHVGYADSYNGRQTSLVGFPFATIRSALAGASITKVELYLYATHCWWNAGATVSIGSHTAGGSAPGSMGSINRTLVSNVHVRGSDHGGESDTARWKVINTGFGNWLRDSSCNGVVLQAPNDNATYYSTLGGVGSSAPAPRLRITYVN